MIEDPTVYVIDISDQTTYQQTGKRRNPALKYRRRNREYLS
jgi:NACalpha-BTF3-like transcription factor